MKSNRVKLLTAAAVLASGLLLYLMVKDFIPLLKQVVANADDETVMIQYIKAYGAKGVPILIGLQFFQVMIPFFPAAPVQVLGGLCYGIWLGSLLCLIGFLLGHILLFLTIRKLGDTFFSSGPKPVSAKENSVLKRLLGKNKMNLENLVFILYLIPLFPNGMLPFVFARTNVSFKKYLLSMTVAMIPSTIICTSVGDRLAAGDLKTALVLAGIFLMIMVVIFLNKNKIINRIDKNKSQES